MWILDGDPGHNNLLKYALNESNYAHTLVILTLSMTTPWSWVEQLQHWIKILEHHIAELKIDPGECLLGGGVTLQKDWDGAGPVLGQNKKKMK